MSHSGEGRTEPVGILLKDGRGGLGRESELKRRKEQAVTHRAMYLQKRQKIQNQQKQHFQDRLSNNLVEKKAERDLSKSQKVCEHLDSQKVQYTCI